MKAVPLRRILMWILVIFALYAVFKSPEKAAEITRAALDGIVQTAHSIARFFDSVLRG